MIDREEPPLPGAIKGFSFPEVKSGDLSNGMALRTARISRLPVVSVHLMMSAGETLVPEFQAGLGALTGDSLQGGTQSRSGSALAEDLESIGASLEVGTGWDATTVSLACLADRLSEAMAILGEVVRRPAFPDDEVLRSLDQRAAQLRQRSMDPGALATDRAAALMYAEGHPYARPLVGTEASLGALSRDDVVTFAQGHHLPGGTAMVVVGDLEESELGALVDREFGDWTGQAPARPSVLAEPRYHDRRIHVIDRPGSVQSELRIGHAGVGRATDDYLELVVANAALGGTFTSRLNMNLREKHGFTYGVRSRFAFRRGEGPFVISTAVGADVTAAAVREAVGELDRYVSEGSTREEIEAVRDFLAGVFPLRLETTGQVASRIGEVLLYDLPDDWHATYRDRVRAVDHLGTTRAFREHVRPEELQIVVVGDAGSIAGPLKELGLGPVEVHPAPA